jgi:cell division protein FtsW
VFRRTLPQSSSDFIYAIIVEEYGLIGGFGVLILYLLPFSIRCSLAQIIRLWKVSRRWAGSSRVLPVTGQTLPLISSGGSDLDDLFCAGNYYQCD